MATEIDDSISIRLALKSMIDEITMDNYVWIYDKSIITHMESKRAGEKSTKPPRKKAQLNVLNKQNIRIIIKKHRWWWADLVWLLFKRIIWFLSIFNVIIHWDAIYLVESVVNSDGFSLPYWNRQTPQTHAHTYILDTQPCEWTATHTQTQRVSEREWASERTQFVWLVASTAL